MKKKEEGITLVALIVTIIILIILAAVTLRALTGDHGILKNAKVASEEHKESQAREILELAMQDLIIDKKVHPEEYNEGEYIDNYLKGQGMEVEGDKVIVDGWIFEIDRDNLEIEKNLGRENSWENGKPKIEEIEIIEVTPNSIRIKVNTAEVGEFTYGIKDITKGETKYTIKANKISENEYEFTGLTENNEYMIQIKLENSKGENIKETEKGIIAKIPEVNKISLEKTEVSIPQGNKETLKVIVSPANARDKSVTWESKDTNIATINNNGEVTGVKEGTVEITVKSNAVPDKKASCRVTILPPPPPSVEIGGASHNAKAISYTWEELGKIAEVISNNTEVTKDTAEVRVSINGKSDVLGIGDTKTVNGKTVRILGFNHDELASENAYGEGKTNTYAGISFDYVDYLFTNRTLRKWLVYRKMVRINR